MLISSFRRESYLHIQEKDDDEEDVLDKEYLFSLGKRVLQESCFLYNGLHHMRQLHHHRRIQCQDAMSEQESGDGSNMQDVSMHQRQYKEIVLGKKFNNDNTRHEKRYKERGSFRQKVRDHEWEKKEDETKTIVKLRVYIIRDKNRSSRRKRRKRSQRTLRSEKPSFLKRRHPFCLRSLFDCLWIACYIFNL